MTLSLTYELSSPSMVRSNGNAISGHYAVLFNNNRLIVSENDYRYLTININSVSVRTTTKTPSSTEWTMPNACKPSIYASSNGERVVEMRKTSTKTTTKTKTTTNNNDNDCYVNNDYFNEVIRPIYVYMCIYKSLYPHTRTYKRSQTSAGSVTASAIGHKGTHTDFRSHVAENLIGSEKQPEHQPSPVSVSSTFFETSAA